MAFLVYSGYVYVTIIFVSGPSYSSLLIIGHYIFQRLYEYEAVAECGILPYIRSFYLRICMKMRKILWLKSDLCQICFAGNRMALATEFCSARYLYLLAYGQQMQSCNSIAGLVLDLAAGMR